MTTNHSRTLAGSCSLLLLMAAPQSWAGCGQISGSITNIPALSGGNFSVVGLNTNGQFSGFSYSDDFQFFNGFLYDQGTLRDLGHLAGSVTIPFALNAAGQVVGESGPDSNGQFHAFLYAGGNLLDLGTLGGSFSAALAINDAGQIAGLANTTGDATQEGFLYNQGALTSLGDLGGGYSSAQAINQAGLIVGESALPSGETHACAWVGGQISDLGTLGGSYSSASALNDDGLIIGQGTVASGDTHAFLYSAGLMQDLGTLGGSSSGARAINRAGQIIGTATTAAENAHAFLYSGGVMQDLGTLGGDTSSAQGLNNLGQVVGTSTTTTGAAHAFIFKDGAMVDLNSLLPAGSGWELTSAEHINDAGRIVGLGTLNGTSQVFILELGTANHAPVAVAGPDQIVECPAGVTLNGLQSSDPDGDALSFEWSYLGTVLGTNPVLTVSLPLGTNLVSLKVSDPCGLSSQANLTVWVADTTAPTVSAPAALSASTDNHCQAPVPNLLGQVVANDACAPAGSLVLSQNPPAGTLVSLGQYPIVVTVKDPSCNSATAQTLFTVQDTTPPVIQSAGASPNSLYPPNHQLVPITVSVAAHDNCDGAPASKIVSITSNEAPAPGDIQITGALTATLAATRDPAGNGRVYTITVQCTDASGNTALTNVFVTVPKSNSTINSQGKGHLK